MKFVYYVIFNQHIRIYVSKLVIYIQTFPNNIASAQNIFKSPFMEVYSNPTFHFSKYNQ